MSSKKYPAPLYAAAGAGDYAYEQLRKLPERLQDLPVKLQGLPVKVSDLRGRVNPGAVDLRVDLDRLRRRARENAETVFGEARTVYAGLVARGRRVVGDDASTDVVLRQSAEVTKPETTAGAAGGSTAKAATKPAKRTRPTSQA